MAQQHQNTPPPPPPPPPHGANAKSSGLPPGNYDIFIIPPHSSGSGFLYLPSLKPNINSFFAGVATTLAGVWAWIVVKPIVVAWLRAVSSSGSVSSVVFLMVAVGIGGWAFGKTGGHFEGFDGSSFGGSPKPNGAASGGPSGGHAGNGYANGGPGGGPAGNGYANGHANGHANGGAHAHGAGGASAGPSPGAGAGNFGGHSHQQQQQQQQQQQHQYAGASGAAGGTAYGREHAYSSTNGSPNNHGSSSNFNSNANQNSSKTYTNSNSGTNARPSPSSAWEKAREETRRREEERKRNEAAAKRAEDERQAKERVEKDARAAAQKARWEQERAREKEAREREERERRATTGGSGAFGAGTKDNTEHAERIRRAAERAEQIRRERAQEDRDRERGAKSERAPATFGVGERTDPYAREGVPPAPKSTIGGGYAAAGDSSPKKPSPAKSAFSYQRPSAQSYTGTTTDHAFRPYETKAPPPPPQHGGSKHAESSHPATQSERSYDATSATSESTAPSSVFSATPYSTADPKKVVILGAYKVNDHHPKPVATVRPGESGITDGLVMRWGTEGVFLDDDRKHEALRQWDVKAWSMKTVESVARPGLMIVRIGIKDPENTRILYFIGDSEEWKVKEGLKTLKGGSLSKGTNFGTLSKGETDKVLKLVGSLA